MSDEHVPFHSWINTQVVDRTPAPTVCKHCNGDGWLLAKDTKLTDIGYTVIFKCFCAVGQANTKRWPTWGRRYEYRYRPISKTHVMDSYGTGEVK